MSAKRLLLKKSKIFQLLDKGLEEDFHSITRFRNKLHSGQSWSDEDILDLFAFQAAHCSVYAQWLDYRKINPSSVSLITEIPFLPITLFKSFPIKSDSLLPSSYFESSGTTGATSSRHYYDELALDSYQKHSQALFENQMGALAGSWVLGLLPNYLEKGRSSLVAMVQSLMGATGQDLGEAFFLHDFQALKEVLWQSVDSDREVVLFGVSYALLDFTDFCGPLPKELKIKLIETGGMKGKRKEWVKAQLHEVLKRRLEIDKVYSEYGMTELFSQAYTSGTDDTFGVPNSMRILRRNVEDPLEVSAEAGRGVLNIIDCANIHSCSFIETADLGELLAANQFRVLGRLDQAEVRGCNLMYTID